MKVKLSYELTMKLISIEIDDMSILNFSDGYDIEFYIELNEKLVKECLIWMHHIETYFKTSYDAYRIDIGPFRGLWPVTAYYNSVGVTFRADSYNPKYKNWKDWFEIEEVENPPQFIQGE